MKRFIGTLTVLIFAMLAPPLLAQVTITNVYVSASTSTTATIVWTTSGPATSQVHYGFDASIPFANAVNHDLVTSHSMTLTILQAERLYYFAVVSVDGAGHSTQSSTSNFSLCSASSSPLIPAQGTVNNYYQYGTFTMTWIPPTGSSGSPSACGQPFSATVTGTLSGGASLSASVGDSYKAIPGPGSWHISVTDAGNLAPIAINYPLSSVSNDVSTQLQTQAATAGLTACLANTLSSTTFPAVCGSSGSSLVVQINGTPISPSSPADFVDTGSVTWAFTGGHIQATAAGGGGGCTSAGLSGVFQLSNGSGGCMAADADFNQSAAGNFVFGVNTNPGFVVNAGTDGGGFGIQLNNSHATTLSTSNGLQIRDGDNGLVLGAISIFESSAAGGIIVSDAGGGIDIIETGRSGGTLDGHGIDLSANGGFEVTNSLQSISTNPTSFGMEIDNDSNPSTLTPSFPGEYGIVIQDETADGIYLNEIGTGQISLAADTIKANTPSFILQGTSGGKATISTSALGSSDNWTWTVPLISGTFVMYTGSLTANHCLQVNATANGIIDAGATCGTGGSGSAFNAITSGSNTTATMVVGSGGSLSFTGTGILNASQINGITVSGTPSTGQVLTATSSSAANWQAAPGAPAFSAITSATNTTAAMVVGSGASLGYIGSGAINASTVGAVALSGLCQTTGTGCPQLPITKASTAHQWINSYTSSTGVFTAAQPAFTDISGQATNSQLANLLANTVLGALTATTPTGLAMPSCSGGSNALIWTSGTGFGCNTITTGSSAFSALTGGTNTTAAMVVGAGATLNFTSSGTINASSVGGVALTGLCQTGGTGCPQLAVTKASVSHQFFTSYTSSTGLFTAAQPAFTDISGQATNAQLATQTANTVLGALTATTPSGLAMPPCSGASSALIWTSGTGFGCNTITAGSIAFSSITGSTNTTAAMVVGAGASLNFTSTGTINASSVGGIALTGLCQTAGTGCPPQPVTKNVVTHQWINSYTSATGLFTSSQPAFSDISGQATNAQLATQTANTVLGALTATTPSGLAMPSCSGASSALIWTSGTGFGCNTIANTGNTTSTSLTSNSLPKANGANSIINSLFTDSGTVGAYTGTGGFSTPSLSLSDTVNNGQDSYTTGSGGDSTCVLNTTSASYTNCVKSGIPQVSVGSSGPYVPYALTNTYATLTDGAPITWAIPAGVQLPNATVTLVHTLSTRALNITGLVSGASGVLIIKQDSTGGAALTLGTGCTWKIVGGGAGAIVLTGTANSIDILAWSYDGTNCYGVLDANFN